MCLCSIEATKVAASKAYVFYTRLFPFSQKYLLVSISAWKSAFIAGLVGSRYLASEFSFFGLLHSNADSHTSQWDTRLGRTWCFAVINCYLYCFYEIGSHT